MTTTACPDRPSLFVAQPPLGNDGRPKIQRVLIANRGEIACRVIATCRKLNLISIAIYAPEDAESRHVQDADEAIDIGSMDQSGGNPFLNIGLLVEVALSTGADAVHPGYGYLSENSAFADAVREAGLVFIGPTSNAMSTLGDKRTSKAYLAKHEPSVPLIPGFAGASQEVDELENEAAKIGFPVMIKASAGGGGKGMRIVREKSKLREELERVQSEAQRSFGSSDCILEKYIDAGKHVEIQIVGDLHGKVVSFWERECSVQRRNQKVIEETPCPWLTPERRKKMSEVAVKIGSLLRYESAGTVEFVVDVKTGQFYFLEVNARLQVEHPITEEVTGVDLVALQLFVAAGGSLATLPVLQQVPQVGHAIECRLCAEDPQNDFAPAHGIVRLWETPVLATLSEARDIRFETAMRTGSRVSIYFDSMIAKIVVWAPTRPLAVQKMIKVMSSTVCAGVRTNQVFLQACLSNRAFNDPAYTTSFIPQNLQNLLRNPFSDKANELQRLFSVIPSLFLRHLRSNGDPSVAAVTTPFRNVRFGFRNQPTDPVNFQTDVVVAVDPAASRVPSDQQSPIICIWKSAPPNSESPRHYAVHVAAVPPPTNDASAETQSPAGQTTARYNAISSALRSGALASTTTLFHVSVDSFAAHLAPDATHPTPWTAGRIVVSVNGAKVAAHVATDSLAYTSPSPDTAQAQRVFVHLPALGATVEYRCQSLLCFCESERSAAAGGGEAALKTVLAPMPCKVLRILKKNGEAVKAGESVMVVESMKMEMNISVGAAGKFDTKHAVGDAVDEGVLLCSVE